MFLAQLFRYNKLLFFGVLAFLLLYIFLNYKWGIAATPVQQYGMFSGPAHINDSLAVYVVEVNGQTINESGITQTQRDIIQSYPALYANQATNNAAVYNVVSPLFTYMGISKEGHRAKFFNRTEEHSFGDWYKLKLARMINEPIRTLELYRQELKWYNGRLIANGEPVKISLLAAK